MQALNLQKRATFDFCRGFGLGQPGDRVDEGAGIGVLGLQQHLLGRASLDDLPLFHDDHPVGDIGHHAKVMGDEDHRHATLAPQVFDQLEDLRLRGHIKRGGRLIRDQDVRLQRQGHRDHHPLPLPARKLEGIGPDRCFGVGNTDLLQQLERPRAAFGPGERAVGLEHLGDLRADAHQRVQRAQGFLKNHRNAAAAQSQHLFLRQPKDRLPVKGDAALVGQNPLRQQPHHRIGRHGFARPAFAHDAEDLPRGEVKVDVLRGIEPIRPHGQSDRQVTDAKQGHSDFLVNRGFSASFRPSPIRFSASTVSRIAMPGRKDSHQAVRITVRAAPII